MKMRQARTKAIFSGTVLPARATSESGCPLEAPAFGLAFALPPANLFATTKKQSLQLLHKPCACRCTTGCCRRGLRRVTLLAQSFQLVPHQRHGVGCCHHRDDRVSKLHQISSSSGIQLRLDGKLSLLGLFQVDTAAVANAVRVIRGICVWLSSSHHRLDLGPRRTHAWPCMHMHDSPGWHDIGTHTDVSKENTTEMLSRHSENFFSCI